MIQKGFQPWMVSAIALIVTTGLSATALAQEVCVRTRSGQVVCGELVRGTTGVPEFNNPQQQINQFYRDILERDADNAGLRSFLQQYRSGVSLDEIRRRIAYSTETSQRLGSVFSQVTGRQIPGGRLRQYVEQLATGTTMVQIRQEIGSRGTTSFPNNNPNFPNTPISSDLEFQINRFYQEILERNADRRALNDYTRAAQSGVSLTEIRRRIAFSSEAAQKINEIYQQFLGRPATRVA
ncbi:MAG: hypothetical protein HC919_09760 [Oscillatoriales cyanobacterium SM2_2_1]|nr:hypothetical protein [Oscillatoriales cyanobacterium SM2_2_1]